MKDVVRLTGVSEFLLRAWELRYNCIKPLKSDSGRRFYPSSEIEKIKLLHQLTKTGIPIRKLAPLDLDDLRMLALESGQSQRLSNTARSLLQKLIEFDLEEFHKELKRHFQRQNETDFLLETVSPLMREVGHLVHDEKISIFQEHAFSASMRTIVGEILMRKYRPNKKQLKIVLATPELNLHEFGILIAAALCAVHGHHVTYLGPHLPIKEMIKACEKTNADILILSTVENPTHMIKDLDGHLPLKCQVWLGGQFQSDFIPKKRQYKYLPSFQELVKWI